MTLALHHSPTKTELESIERRKRFKAHITALADKIAAAKVVKVIPPKPLPEPPPVPSLHDWMFMATGGDASIPNMTKSIQIAVGRKFQVNRNDILSIRRNQKEVFARHVSM